jgi:hypothetical protein
MPEHALLKTDVAWDPGEHLALTAPDQIMPLEQFGPGAAGSSALSPVAVTSPFRILSDAGTARLQEICRDLEELAGGDERIARRARNGMYHARFLQGLASDPELIGFLRQLAGAPLEPHPISHQAIHVNYAPPGGGLQVVDQGWHWDGVSFDYVMMVSDPGPMRGGRFEYYQGPVEEGERLLASGKPLPEDRIVRPSFPGPGWAIFMQAHRVLHHVEPLAEAYPRITLIGSFYTYDPVIPDPQQHTGPLYDSDPADMAITEWARFSAVTAARKLSQADSAESAFALDLPALKVVIADASAILEAAGREIGRYAQDPDLSAAAGQDGPPASSPGRQQEASAR